MNGCQWRKRKFSVPVNCSEDTYNRIFGPKSKCCNEYAKKENGIYICSKCNKQCEIKEKK